MACQLINIESDKKITLFPGIHVLGRGKLFEVYDARVSRKHGKLEVTNDALTVTALHENPCFYKKGDTMEVQVLRQNSSVSLNTGDKLGLLPNTHWYEVLQRIPLDIKENEVPKEAHEKIVDASANFDAETDEEAESRLAPVASKEVTSENNNLELESTQNYNAECTQVPPQCKSIKEPDLKDEHCSKENSVEENVHLSSTSQAICDNTASKNVIENESNIDEPGSPSLLTNQQEDQSSSESLIPSESGSPLKRPHENDDGEQSDEAKKSKSDTEEKPDVKLDSNADQASSSNSNDNANPGALPQARLRERCMYGANCYRRNPVHLSQYSHPRDADWGAGERAPCPWGAACAKRDARHWRDHDHPAPHDRPPQHRGNKKNRNRGNTSPQNLVVTGKRARKTVARDSWSDSNESDSDPFNTDEESEEWQPSSEFTETMD